MLTSGSEPSSSARWSTTSPSPRSTVSSNAVAMRLPFVDGCFTLAVCHHGANPNEKINAPNSIFLGNVTHSREQLGEILDPRFIVRVAMPPLRGQDPFLLLAHAGRDGR